MLPDSRATILGPPADWGDAKFRVPAFACMSARRPGSGFPFFASVLLHVLGVLCFPAFLRSLPREQDGVVRARLMSPLQAAMILRMPNRLYLPVRSTLLADPRSASAAGEQSRDRPGPGRNEAQVSGTGSSGAGLTRRAPVRPVLIQPGKPIATDLRTLRLPSLLYLSESKAPAPPGAVAPGSKATPEPAPGIPAAMTIHPPGPVRKAPSTIKLSPSATVAKTIVPPALPAPSAWSLLLHDYWGEVMPQVGKTESGVDVSVLSIATNAPRAGQLVEVPPVNQPAATGGGAPSGSPPGLPGERHASEAAANATTPSAALSHNTSAENTAGRRGENAARGRSQAEAHSAGNKLGSQASAAVAGAARSQATPLGRVQVLDLPGGAQQWQFPVGGSFDVVIVQPSPDATIPDAGRFLTGRPVQTVYITLGTGQDWVLQYCLPPSGAAASQSGMVVTLGSQPKLDAPFIQQALVPPQTLLRGTQPALFQAMLDGHGRFVGLHPVTDSNYRPLMALMPFLERWQFRPAKLDGVPVEVEILLLIPLSSGQ